jgi:hypothetical protein
MGAVVRRVMISAGAKASPAEYLTDLRDQLEPEALTCSACVARYHLAPGVPKVTRSTRDRKDVRLSRREVEWA